MTRVRRSIVTSRLILKLLSRYSGKDLTLREAIREKRSQLQSELSGPTPTTSERLLIDRVVVCWLHLQLAELRLANSTSVSEAQSRYLHKRIDQCHRQYLSAIKMLTTVRKLAIPAMRVEQPTASKWHARFNGGVVSGANQ